MPRGRGYGTLGVSPLLEIASGLARGKLANQEVERSATAAAEKIMAPRREKRRMQELARTQLGTLDPTIGDDAFDETRDYEGDLVERRLIRRRAQAYRTVVPSVSLEQAEALMIAGPNAQQRLTPVRGTPEYNEMLRREAAARRRSPAAADTTRYEERAEPNGGVAIYKDGQFEKWKSPPTSASAQLPTAGERKAAAFYATGKHGYETLERIIAGDDLSTPAVEKTPGKEVPGFFATQAARVGLGTGNLMTSDQVRQMRASGQLLSDAWLRYTSGAAVPEQEVERFAQSVIPQAGDDKGTLRIKADARRVIIDAIEAGAGRARDRADDGAFAQALERIQTLDPAAAAIMVKYRNASGTQPDVTDIYETYGLTPPPGEP